MVRVAVCYPFYSKVQLFKNGKKKAFKLSLGPYDPNIPYKPWEADYKQIMDYLYQIKIKGSKPFDQLVVILDSNYKNNFRKHFVQIATSWKFMNVRIIDSFHISLFGAIFQLNIQPDENDVIWEISLFREHIRCRIWTFDICDGWNLTETVSLPITPDCPTKADWQKLQIKLTFRSLHLPHIVLHHLNRRQHAEFCEVFSYLQTRVYKYAARDPCKLALKYGRGLAGEFTHERYRCRPILNRTIEIRNQNVRLFDFDRFQTLPKFEFAYTNSERKNGVEIFECGTKTTVTDFIGKTGRKFCVEVDANGIFHVIW